MPCGVSPRVVAMAAVLSAACSTVLGLEDRELDPKLTNTGGAGGAGGSGTAGCDSYCDEVMAACTDPYAQYATRDTCMAVCAALEPGDSANTTAGNTVACRLSQAKLAANTGEKDVYCTSAGPSGGTSIPAGFGCGRPCDGYCTLMLAFCPEEFPGGQVECQNVCSALPDLGGYAAVPPATGDNIQCRIYHVNAAALDAFAHCGHASGLTPCADPGGDS